MPTEISEIVIQDVFIFSCLAAIPASFCLYGILLIRHYFFSKKYRRENADGLYCTKCSAPTYIVKRLDRYEAKSGNRITKNIRRCPNDDPHGLGYGRADHHVYNDW